jgi:hypothetical protein
MGERAPGRGEEAPGAGVIDKHRKDEDCTLDATGACMVCGRHHGQPCPRCTGRAYHREGCDLEDTFDESFGEV